MEQRKIISIFFLIISIVWIISFSLCINNVSVIQSNYRKVDDFCIQKSLELEPEPGIKIATKIFIPKIFGDSTPAVILQHGLGGRKENLMGFALTFVNRGFVAMICDLRGHGFSTGSSTFGMKESDDLVFAMNYLLNTVSGSEFQGKILKISDVGFVGHSLGALTVTLASYKSGANSCVVLAPPSQVGTLLTQISEMGYRTINNLVPTQMLITQDFVDTINLYNYVNRTAENPKPKNYLVITTDNDRSVPDTEVYNYFKAITKLDNPEPFTTYGSFAVQNATQFNNYTGKDHNDQQYVESNGNITKDAILWTERALGINNSATVEIPSIVDSIAANRALWGPISATFYVSSLCIVLLAACLLYLWFGIRSTESLMSYSSNDEQTSREIMENIKIFLSNKQFKTTYSLSLLLLVGFALLRQNFGTFVRIITISPFLGFLAPMLLATLLNRNNKVNPKRFPVLFVSILVGIVVGLYICGVQTLIGTWTTMELIFYPFELPQLQVFALISFVVCFMVPYFSISEAYNESFQNVVPIKKNFIKIIAFFLIYGSLSLIYFLLSPYGRIFIFGFPIGLLMGFVPIAIILLIEILNILFDPVGKNSGFTVAVVSFVLGWILVNSLVIF